MTTNGKKLEPPDLSQYHENRRNFPPDELAKYFRFKIGDKLLKGFPISRHRLRTNDIAACDLSTFRVPKTETVVGTLST